MDLQRLIDQLSRPLSYGTAVDRVEVRQTHISVVFLAGRYAYKVKKPVDLGFLDFSTLARRRHFCDQEVQLNRRLAPSVYAGVVPITEGEHGLEVEGRGEPVEYAVKMIRLAESAQLRQLLEHDLLCRDLVIELARRLAVFHRDAASGEEVVAAARYAPVRRNVSDNLIAGEGQVGRTVTREVFERLRQLTEAELEKTRAQIENRAAAGRPRDAHGDLHLDHVYYFPERRPPDDLVIIDCIEFSPRFRFIDPVADMAFLAMDLGFRGRPDLSREFVDAYFAAAGDEAGRDLLPLYTAYRSAVRAKVNGIGSDEVEVPEEERRSLLRRARAHWLYALGELESPRRRPAIVLVGGLPGTGKSTLARSLAAAAGFTVISSDRVRKELAGIAPTERGGEGLYTSQWNDRTYAECLRRAEAVATDGGRVLVDGTFRDQQQRQRFLDAAVQLGVRCAFLVCEVDPALVRGRLAHRTGDVSDADAAVYETVRAQWDEPSPRTSRVMYVVKNREEGAAIREALAALTRVGLLDAAEQA